MLFGVYRGSRDDVVCQDPVSHCSYVLALLWWDGSTQRVILAHPISWLKSFSALALWDIQ